MTENIVVKSLTEETTSELETVLVCHRSILQRLCGFQKRLAMMHDRLYGETPTTADDEQDTDVETGVIGQFRRTHDALHNRCDSIEEWLNCLERVI